MSSKKREAEKKVQRIRVKGRMKGGREVKKRG
jgi:hypothetical protein